MPFYLLLLLKNGNKESETNYQKKQQRFRVYSLSVYPYHVTNSLTVYVLFNVIFLSISHNIIPQSSFSLALSLCKSIFTHLYLVLHTSVHVMQLLVVHISPLQDVSISNANSAQ